MFFIIAVFLYVTLVGYEHKIRRLHGTLQLLSEFHKTHIHIHKCESWENYIENLQSEEKKSTRLQNLKFYIDYCERIGSVLPERTTPISEHHNDILNDTIDVRCSENCYIVDMKYDITLSVKKNKNQDENSLVQDKVDQSERFLKLSDEAKKIVFEQLFNITFFPEKESKVFHYPAGFSAEAFTSDKLLSESTRFYREGILAGYFYALYYLHEHEWKKILDTDGGIFNVNENEFQPILTKIAHTLVVGITARESQYLASFDVERNTKNHLASYFYWGFLKGREYVRSLQINAIQEIKEIREKISKQDQEKGTVTLPTLEALLFLTQTVKQKH
jgi:hypothetical protein